ncbi:MAG: DUF1573 domain-containing protein [Chitinophagales bacterium]|nr:DUF1573 domain-containing protein [Chitinophagales bacterium]
MRICFALFLLLPCFGMAQLSTNINTLDFGTFSVDSIPIKIVELKITNITTKSIPIHTLECNTFLFNPSLNRVSGEGPILFQMPEKNILVKPKQTRSVFFYPDKHRFHTMDVHYDTASLFSICYGKDYQFKEIPIVYNVVPNIQWETSTLNLGRCKQGDVLKAVFRFKNTTANTIHWENGWFNGNGIGDSVLYPRIVLPYASDSVVFRVNTTYEADSIIKSFELHPAFNFEDSKLGDDMPYLLHYVYVVDSFHFFATIDFEATSINTIVDHLGPIDFTYAFSNKGTAPLHIYSCKGSSGSVVPIYPQHPILSNESAEIKVHYDCNYVGPFTKTVAIVSNARKHPYKVLVLSGSVK